MAHEQDSEGLRREEVAILAGVSIDYYVRMERGNLAGASDAVLDGVASALQLDEAERAHLFDLARASVAAAAADQDLWPHRRYPADPRCHERRARMGT